MRKKFLSCMLCAAMALSLCACGSKDDSNAGGTQNEATTGSETTGTETTGTETTGTETKEDATTGSETTGSETTGSETTGSETTGSETTGSETTGTVEETTTLSATGRIEFENYFESDAVSTEASGDDDTLSLCGLNQSGYAAYELDLGDGGYEQIAIRYSSATAGGKVEIRYMAPDGDLLGEFELPGTGDWSTYQTVNVDVPNLATFARKKALYFVFSGEEYLFNLNWFQLYNIVDVNGKIESENFAGSNAIVAQDTNDESGEMELGGIQNGSWNMYKLNFGDGGYSTLQLRASSGTNGGTVEVRRGAVDGELLGTVAISGTGAWENYDTFSADIPALADLTGVQDLYLVYTGSDYLFNLNWFAFYKPALDVSQRVQAEDFIETTTVNEPSPDEDGTNNLGGVMSGTYAAYLFDFGEGGYNKMKVRASSPQNGGEIVMHAGSLDGEVICTVTIGDYTYYGTDWANYGDWDLEVPELASLTGEQVIYFEFIALGGSHCFNINWYEFSK